MRTIGVVTTSRADYGIYRPLLRAIMEEPDLTLHLLVSGMHLCPEFGNTVREIEADGLPIAARIEMMLASDTPQSISKAMGLGVISFAQEYARIRPDLLVLLGDRYEMAAAALAALPFIIPLAHLHGGEVTEGAIDEAIRHSLTKMSHLHFVATDTYRRRVEQMGEEPWRITVSGALSLDNLATVPVLSLDDLAVRYPIQPKAPFLLVTFHPLTLAYEQTATQIDALLWALDQFAHSIIFTYPNADTSSRVIIERVTQYVNHTPRAHFVTNLGTTGYFNLMRHAAAMVGNSSSGIIEAASFKLPVVNIGNRQGGRLCAENVIHIAADGPAIVDGIQRAIAPAFRASLATLRNPYGDGDAAPRIVERLKSVPLDGTLLTKRFIDLPVSLREVV